MMSMPKMGVTGTPVQRGVGTGESRAAPAADIGDTTTNKPLPGSDHGTRGIDVTDTPVPRGPYAGKLLAPVERLGRPAQASSLTDIHTSLLAPQVPREVAQFCMNLLLLDDHLTTRDEFGEFCTDMYTLECYITALSRLSATCWHAGMPRQQLKHAALCCSYVTVCFDRALAPLGDNGRAGLSRVVHDGGSGVSYCVQMVWAYMDWHSTQTSVAQRRRGGRGSKGVVSVWDTVFTPEAVSQDAVLRCAVRIGTEAVKIDPAAVFEKYNPFAHRNLLSLYA